MRMVLFVLFIVVLNFTTSAQDQKDRPAKQEENVDSNYLRHSSLFKVSWLEAAEKARLVDTTFTRVNYEDFDFFTPKPHFYHNESDIIYWFNSDGTITPKAMKKNGRLTYEKKNQE